MRNLLLLLAVFISQNLFAQAITNHLHGYFEATSDTVLYDYFSFDGNGKVDIAGYGDRDYFQKGDTVIVFPDKSMFRFLWKDAALTGISEWVSGGEWRKKDTLIENRRSENGAADRTALLLNRYYNINNESNRMLYFEDPELYKREIKALCDSGLAMGCSVLFGLKVLDEMGGLSALLDNDAGKKKMKANPELIALGEKIISLGDMEGYNTLGEYYKMTGDVKKAKEMYEKGVELGCSACAVSIFGMEIDENVEKNSSEKTPVKRKK